MPPVLELVTSFLGGNDTFDKLADLIGAESADQASAAVALSAPAILGGLAERTQDESGLETVMGMLDDNRSVLGDLGGFLDRGETEAGNTILDFLFGGERADLVSGLAAKADLGGSVIGKLLPMLAPAVTTVVANERFVQELDGPGVATMLDNEVAALHREGIAYTVDDFPPPSGAGAGVKAGAIAGAAGVAGATAAAGSKAAGAGAEAVDGAADVGPDAADAITAAGDDAGADASGVIADGANAAAGAAGAGVEEVAAGSGDAAGAATDAATTAATKAGVAKKSVTAGAKSAPDKDQERDGDGGGLGWLWWAIGAVALVLLLAWLLSQCNDEESVADGSDTTEVAVEADGEGDTPDADSDAVADSDSDDGAGGDSGSVQDAVDRALEGTGVTGVLSGGTVTLTGSVDDGSDSADAEDAVSAIDGVRSVDNEIRIQGGAASDSDSDSNEGGGDADSDGSSPGDLDAGDSINELLDLDPVTFRVSSATITEEGKVVLDGAAEFLDDNPDIEIEIGGHTDNDGATAENLDLSQRRADAVQAYLEQQGVDGDRMTAKGYGESEPKVPNTSSSAKAENRRIEFTVL